MSEADGALRVVIWVPDGLSSRHWVHGCQFVAGAFELRRSPAGGAGPDRPGGAAANASARAPAEEVPAGQRTGPDSGDPAGRFGGEDGTSRQRAAAAAEQGDRTGRPGMAAVAERAGLREDAE